MSNYKQYYVYIMASKMRGTLYTGVTNDLTRRMYEHKHKILKGFTSRYNIKQLVYYEIFIDINEAITREKRIKNWKRAWKIQLIETVNPEWTEIKFDNLHFHS